MTYAADSWATAGWAADVSAAYYDVTTPTAQLQAITNVVGCYASNGTVPGRGVAIDALALIQLALMLRK